MNSWTILPVKPLSQSKTRLSHVLSPAARAALSQHLLEHTLRVLQQVSGIAQILVVSRDDLVLNIARRYHTRTFTESAPYELKTAVTQAAKYATLYGVDRILIIPADLPFLQAYELQNMLNKATPSTCVICPDEKQNGTNALILPPSTNFKFQYGLNSYQKHLAQAKRLKLPVKTITTPGICFDLDTEADWHIYQQTPAVNS